MQASASVSRIFDYLNVDADIQEVNTVNGWVAMELDHLPRRDDRFETELGGKYLKVRVTKADDRKAVEINLVCEDIEEDEERKGKKKVARYRAMSWESSNTKIATVKKGKVIAGKKGSCTIYAYAQNGVYTTFRITVR